MKVIDTMKKLNETLVATVTSQGRENHMDDPKTLAQLRKAIKKHVDPRLELAANKLGGSYYYWYANDEVLGPALIRLETTSVLVCNWSHLTLADWIQEARDIMRQAQEKNNDLMNP